METKGVRVRANFLNPYDELEFNYGGNPLFDKADFDELRYNRSSKDMDTYLNLISQYDKLNIDSLKNDYFFDDMPLDNKLLKMSMDLGYIDNTDKKSYDIVVGYNSRGEEILEKQDLTEYEYYNKLLNEWVSYKQERKLLEEKQSNKALKSGWEIWWNSVGATIGELVIGGYDVVENMVNFADATIDTIAQLVNPAKDNKNNWTEAMAKFREQMSDDETLPHLYEIADELHKELIEWERDNTYYVDIDGNYTDIGKIFGGVAYSIGQQLPAMAITALGGGALGNIGFYTSIFESKLQDRFRDDVIANNPSISTEFIIGEALFETYVEYQVEKWLGGAFGGTAQDLARGISGVGKFSTGISRLLADALQEGTEEVLQDTLSWLVSQAAGIIHDDYRSDITFQQLWDAFVGGAVASLVTGGFAEIRRTYNDYKNSKSLVSLDANYYALGNISEKGETKAQKEYRRGKLRATKAALELSKLEENANTVTKSNKRLLGTKDTFFGKIGHGISSIIKGFNNAVDGIDVTTKEGQKAVALLNKQFYIGMKAIFSTYGEFGAERMVAAEKLLSELDAYSNKKKLTAQDRREYAVKSSNIATKISKNITTLYKDKKKINVAKMLSDEDKDANITEEDIDRISSYMEMPDEEVEKLGDDEQKVAKKVKELELVFDHYVTLWGIDKIVEKDGIIFAKEEAVKNLPAKEIIKSAAENTLIEAYKTSIPKAILEHFVQKYNEYNGPLYEGEDLETVVITHLLYDVNFYNYLLNRADIASFNVLKSLDNTLQKIIDANNNMTMRKEYIEAVKRVKSTMGPALILYCINNPYVNLDNVTVLNKAQIEYIQNKLASHKLVTDVINNYNGDGKLQEKINILKNKINSLPITKSMKEELSNMLDNEDTREEAIEQINDELKGYWFGKYDDKTYPKDQTPNNARLTAFLQNYGITLDDIRQGNSYNLPEDAKNSIDVRNKYEVQSYLIELFNLFTNGEYVLKIQGNNVYVEQITKQKSKGKLSVNTVVKSVKSAYEKKFVRIRGGLLLETYLSNIVKVSGIELSYSSVNDVIVNPEKYLKDDVLAKIRSKYGVINTTTVSNYIKQLLFKSNVTVVLDTDGLYKFATFVAFKDVLSSKYIDKYNSNDDLLKPGTHYATEFIKNVPEQLKNTVVKILPIEQRPSRENGLAIYNPNRNEITVYLDKDGIVTNKDLIDIIVHEYQHALQNFDNLSQGFGTDFNLSKEFVDDFKKYVPTIYNTLKSSSTTNNLSLNEKIKLFIYSSVTGEVDADGLYELYKDISPFYVLDKGDKMYIVAPWGKKYDVLTGKGFAKKIKEQSLSERYDEAIVYKNNIDNAINLIKENDAKKIKTYKKDLKQFKLPDEVVTKLVNKTYKKSEDNLLEQYNRIIASYKRQQRKNKYKAHAAEGKKSLRGRALFEKNVKGTNLEYWLKKYPDKIPEVDPAVQEFVISATDFTKLDKWLVDKIKNAELTLRDIYNYVRDAKSINDYTFNELKKAFFKNTPFNTFNEVKSFVLIVEDAYALKAALLNIGAEHLVDKIIKWDLKDYKKNFDKMKSDASLEKIVNDTLLRFNVFWQVGSDGKRKKHDVNMEDARADIILGLLKYFDRSIDSLAYIAGNAKYAIQRSITNEQPFTYTQKRDVSGQNTLSIDAQLKGKKDSDSSHSFADVIEDERQRLEGNTDAENRAELVNFAKNYVRELLSEGRIDEATSIGKTVAKNIKQMSDEEVETRLAILNSMDNTGITFEEAFDLNLTTIVTAILDPETVIDVGQKRSNVYNSVKGIVNRLAKSHINGKIYKNLPDEFKKYFNPSNGYRFNADAIKGMNAQQLYDLKTALQTLGQRIRNGEFVSAKAKSEADRLRKENERLRKENEKLKSKQFNEITKENDKPGKTYNVNITEDVDIHTDKPVPNALNELLNTTFYKERESTKKFQRIESQRYLQVSMDEFYSQNADTFNSLTENDVLEILDFFERSTISNRDYVPYDALRVYILAYFVEQINDGTFNLDSSVLDRCNAMLDGIVSNTAARTLSVWRSVMPMVNPKKVIIREMAKKAGIELTDDEVEPLAKALKKLSHTKVVSKDPESFKKAVDEINQVMDNLQRVVLEKYREKIRKGESTLKLFGKEIKVKGKTLSRPAVKILQERFLKFQKAAMLSSPATVVRNKLSNWILGGFTVKGKHIPGMNEIADWIGGSKLFGKDKLVTNQYNLRNVKVSTNTAKFVKDWLLDTGLLDLVSDGLNKYDARTRSAKSDKLEIQLQDMIVDAVTSRIVGQHTFGKGKFTKWLENKRGKIYEHGITDNIVNFVFKMQSDDNAIKQTALRYVGKILESENVDLSNGVDANIMSVIADAYAMSAWEYMHRENFISNLEQTWRQKNPNSYFIAKLVIPFASSSWNWFLETLQMNPVALIVNIRKLNNLEKVVANLDEKRRLGDTSVPSSRFAEMIIRRNIGKGVLGTFLMLAGFGLGALGKIRVDEEDDKLKLTVGNTWIDISNVFSTSSLLVGAALANPSKGSGFSVLENAFNQQFEDSMLTQFINMFRYDNTPWDYISSLPTTIAGTFVPNVWKSAVKLTSNHKVKYSQGILGNLQYLATQTIPFIEYALPKGIDPYTGDWEERYSVPVLHQLASLIGSPVSFKTYHKSDIELEFDSVGISKKELSGKYDDIGNVDRIVLNEYYGKLNNKRISELVNDKTKYSVQDENGKYVEKYYSQMSQEQKKSILNRITNQNASYAKIYVWTKSGHKYYCSSSERLELSKLGITTNVYVGNKGFVR